MAVQRTNRYTEPLGPSSTIVVGWTQPDGLNVMPVAGGGARITFTGNNSTKAIHGPTSSIVGVTGPIVISAQIRTTLVDGDFAAVHFVDSTGADIAPVRFSDGALPGTAWSTQTITTTPPANAVGVRVSVQGYSGASPLLGDTLEIRQVIVQAAAPGGAYFDGSSATAGANLHRWTGTPQLSSSEEFTADPATVAILTTLSPDDQQTVAIETASTQIVETGGTFRLIVTRVQDSMVLADVNTTTWAGADHPSPGSWTYRVNTTYTPAAGAPVNATATSTPAVVVPTPVWTATVTTSVDEMQVVTVTAESVEGPSTVGNLTLVVSRDPALPIGGASDTLIWTGTDDPQAVDLDPQAFTGTVTYTAVYTFVPAGSTTPVVWSATSAPVTLAAKPKKVLTYWDGDRGAVRFEAFSMASNETVFYRAPNNKLVSPRGYETATWPTGRLPGGKDGVGWAYEMPLGVLVRFLIAPVGSTTYSSAYEPTSSVVLTAGNQAWLIDPANPALSHQVTVVSTGDESRPSRQTVYDITGRKNGYVVHDVRHSRQGTVQLLVTETYASPPFWTITEKEQLEADLLDPGRVLLLNLCWTKNFKPCYLAVTDVTWSRFGNGAAFTCDLGYIEVDNPQGLDIEIPTELTYQQARSFPIPSAKYADWQSNGNYLDLFNARVGGVITP